MIVDLRRYSQHETVLQRSKVAGAGRGGPPGAPRASSRDLRRILALHQALAQALSRQTGGLEPRKGVPGPPPRKGAALKEWLPEQLKNNPDLTLREHCEAFEDERGVWVSTATMSRAISKLPGEWPLKKSPR